MTKYLTATYAGDYPLGIFISLKHANARDIFCQLAAALWKEDTSYPDVSKDRQVAFISDEAMAHMDWRLLELVDRFPRIVIVEQGDRKPEAHREPPSSYDERSISPIARFTTGKATFFNYLTSQAIREGLGVEVEVTDNNDVPLLTAQALHAAQGLSRHWNSLDAGEQSRLIAEAKERLCSKAAPRMTARMLVERKAKSEVTRWLYAIKLRLPRQFFD